MSKNTKVAELVGFSIDASRKTRDQIASEAGFARPNVLSMIRKGQMKVPLTSAPKLAVALGLDPGAFLRRVLEEYQPELLEVIDKTSGVGLLTQNEVKILECIRTATKNLDPALVTKEQEREFTKAVKEVLLP